MRPRLAAASHCALTPAPRCDRCRRRLPCAGELELAWVYLEPSWTFARTIAAGALGAKPGRVLLRSEGIDTVATVTLNGQLVGQTANMFHRPVWDVTSAFKPAANNTLEVRIDSPALASLANRNAYPYDVWAGSATPLQYPHCGCEDIAACFTDQQECDCLISCKKSPHNATRNMLRKSQAHWGWDSHWRDCHFADAPSPSLLKHLLKVKGVQQNDSLADG